MSVSVRVRAHACVFVCVCVCLRVTIKMITCVFYVLQNTEIIIPYQNKGRKTIEQKPLSEYHHIVCVTASFNNKKYNKYTTFQ